MILNGSLPPTLKISMIKLIEKANKSDYKNIKSWRPISLLSSFYKLFSGIVDLRMQKVIDRITHRAQKAYSKERVIQENLLNLIETMSKGIHSNNPLALILIDFQGAFDNISHDYIFEALRFHNFGEGFINIVKTCFSGREACIQLEDGFTNRFLVRRSVLQGDRPSPSLPRSAKRDERESEVERETTRRFLRARTTHATSTALFPLIYVDLGGRHRLVYVMIPKGPFSLWCAIFSPKLALPYSFQR